VFALHRIDDDGRRMLLSHSSALTDALRNWTLQRPKTGIVKSTASASGRETEDLDVDESRRNSTEPAWLTRFGDRFRFHGYAAPGAILRRVAARAIFWRILPMILQAGDATVSSSAMSAVTLNGTEPGRFFGVGPQSASDQCASITSFGSRRTDPA
jgi:hypothetical protein